MDWFSDRVGAAIEKTGTVLTAGIDPDIDTIPLCFHREAAASARSDEEFFRRVIVQFYLSTLEAIADSIPTVKPNLAFFEQFGIGGLRAYREITDWCRARGLLIIADAKRGDIGSTAAAYAAAFFGPRTAAGRPVDALYADAVTVNPFLGFDTLEPFVSRAVNCGTGIFILVRTSNPGSADLQGIKQGIDGVDVSLKIAEWISQQGKRLRGTSGISGLGAVVGATHPSELRRMRAAMPDALFLIPGYGAQGGSASDISQARTAHGKGILVNSSRGIFGGISPDASSTETREIVVARVAEACAALVDAR